MNIDIKQAVSASVLVIVVCLTYRYVISLNIKNSKKPNMPIIDYQLACLFCPSIFLGTIFGVMLNVMLPQIIITIVFCILMAYNFKKTIKKAFIFH